MSILDENISNTNEHIEVLGVQGAKIGFKINVKMTTLQILGINDGKEMILENEKIGQVDSFT